MKITRFAATLIVGCLLCTSCTSIQSSSDVAVFPDAGWQPAETTSNLDLKKLDEIDSVMKAAHANGILIMDGKVVKQWTYDGPADKKIEVQSITKSIVSMLLGIAIQEGKIANINDKVSAYYPAFEVGPYTNSITFKHLVTTSSGIKAKKWGSNYIDPNNMAPGIDARYHNDHFDELARALTYIYEEPLIEVLRSRVLSRTGGTAAWDTDGGNSSIELCIRLPDGEKIETTPAGQTFSGPDSSPRSFRTAPGMRTRGYSHLTLTGLGVISLGETSQTSMISEGFWETVKPIAEMSHHID